MAIVRREMGIMAVACLVILFLALRAAGTTPLICYSAFTLRDLGCGSLR